MPTSLVKRRARITCHLSLSFLSFSILSIMYSIWILLFLSFLFLVILSIILYLIFRTKEKLKNNEEDVLNKKQKTFKKTLEDMDDILNQNNIEFTLCCGTALGAYREHKFIEHDSDIDLHVYGIDKNLEKISKIITDSGKFTLLRFWPKDKPLRNASEITLKHKETNINVDIFKVIKRNHKYIHYNYGSLCDYKPNRRCEFENSIHKINNINFMGRIYKIPEFKYIVETYGKDWDTPKKYSYSQGLRSHNPSLVK